jgi:hypothetical protein
VTPPPSTAFLDDPNVDDQSKENCKSDDQQGHWPRAHIPKLMKIVNDFVNIHPVSKILQPQQDFCETLGILTRIFAVLACLV